MGSYNVAWRSAARRELRNLDRVVIQRIVAAVDDLVENPFPAGTRKLRGSYNTYRIRVGDFRILYIVNSSEKSVIVTAVGHRRDVYNR